MGTGERPRCGPCVAPGSVEGTWSGWVVAVSTEACSCVVCPFYRLPLFNQLSAVARYRRLRTLNFVVVCRASRCSVGDAAVYTCALVSSCPLVVVPLVAAVSMYVSAPSVPCPCPVCVYCLSYYPPLFVEPTTVVSFCCPLTLVGCRLLPSSPTSTYTRTYVVGTSSNVLAV